MVNELGRHSLGDMVEKHSFHSAQVRPRLGAAWTADQSISVTVFLTLPKKPFIVPDASKTGTDLPNSWLKMKDTVHHGKI